VGNEFVKSADAKKSAVPASVYILLIIDAVVYLCAGYFSQLYNLLHFDGVAPAWKYAAACAVGFTSVFLLSLAFGRTTGKPGTLRAACDAALMLAIAVGPLMFLETAPVRKGMSIYWMPTEWIKLPRAVAFGAKVTLPFFAVVSAPLLAGGFLWVRKQRAIWLAPGTTLVAAAMVFCLLQMDMDDRRPLYAAVMLGPVSLVAAGAVMGYNRLVFRALALTLAVNAIFPFYFGLFPYFSGGSRLDLAACRLTPGCDMRFGDGPEAPAPGAERLYPRGGVKPEFSLAFLREFYLDRKMNVLFSSFGPTCGFIRFNLTTGDMEVMNYRSLVRYTWSEDDIPYLVSPDWIEDDILIIDKKSFSIKKRVDLYEQGVRVPAAVQADERYIYILSAEPPALARYEKDTLEPAGTIDFRKLGFTPHSHGAYAMVMDPTGRRAFVQLGVYDLSYTFRLVRVNTETFRPEADRSVKTGSIIMTALPSKGTLLMYDYYSDSVDEYEMATMKFLRRFRGVFNCRSAALDEKRGLLYMAGAGLGELAAVEYSSGKIVRKNHMGNKAGSMFYDESGDFLLVGGGSGIYRVDLSSFTGIRK